MWSELSRIPILAGLAGLSYLTFVGVLCHPGVRHRVAAWLVPPMPSSQAHLAALDALRGLAALWVASFHFWQWPQPVFDATFAAAPIIAMGEKAVPVFVVLSGFLIYRAVLPIATVADFRDYLRGRFLRIYPLYAVAVTAALLLGQFRADIPTVQSVLAEFFMVRTIGFPGFVIPPIWSLYVEVLFYLLLPAFVVVARARPIALAMLAFVVLTLSDSLGPRELDLWRFFFVGIVASELQQRFDRSIPEPLALAVFAGGLGIFATDLYYALPNDFDWLTYGIEQLFPTLRLTALNPCCTLGLALGIGLLMLGATWSRLLSRFFSRYLWRYLAAVSYSVFVWHGFLIIAAFPIRFDGTGNIRRLAPMPAPLAGWVLPLVVIPAILGVATLSYLAIERPFLLLRRRRRSQSQATPAVSGTETTVAAPATHR